MFLKLASKQLPRIQPGLQLTRASLRYKSKYDSIESFNKNKKEYKFGYGVDSLEEATGEDAVGNDPRLAGLKPNSAEYKYQQHLIREEGKEELEQSRKKWERIERLKGFGAGIGALVGILSVYLLVMNYKYIKAYVRNKWNFDIDYSKISDLNDPKGNLKKTEKLVERLAAEIDLEFCSNVVSSETSGLYLFGEFGKKLPARVPFFDGQYLKDVALAKDYVVVVDEKGKVFHYGKNFSRPVEVLLPQKVTSAIFSGDKIYYLGQKNQIMFGPKLEAQDEKHDWLLSAVAYPSGMLKIDLERNEKIAELSTGDSNLLLLTSKGRLFLACTKNSVNKGQFGLPTYAPTQNVTVPVDEAFALTNMNNEIVVGINGKEVKPRKFTSIASGNNFNVASDSSGNIWTWGDNAYGQCGRETGSNGTIQPVPRVAFSLSDLKRILKYSLPESNGEFTVDLVYAAGETSYIQVNYEGPGSEQQDLLLSFGNGLKGQSGTSRYVHVNPTPTVIKSLLSLSEFDEAQNKVVNIGIKSVSAGNNHVFVTLNTQGAKDVLAFGDNEAGQFGNGKNVKSSKPLQLPKLIEPADLKTDRKKLAKKVNEVNTNRLQLSEEKMKKSLVEQVVVAGGNGLAIYYRKC